METIELRPRTLVAGGDAIAKDSEGRVVFVSGALPGELVSAEITVTKKDFRRAQVVEVLEPHASRQSPPCPLVRAGCGGCDLQHATPDLQRELKRDIVVDALMRIGHVADPIVNLGPLLDAHAYRTTMRFAVDSDGWLNMHRSNSTDLVRVKTCHVAHPLINSLVDNICVPGGKEVVLRAAVHTSETMIVVDEQSNKKFIHEHIHGVKLRISAASFFQGRPDGAEALIDAVHAALTGAPSGPRLDAYGGVGMFSAVLSARYPEHLGPWTIVESSKAAIADAKENVPNAYHINSDMAKWQPRKMAAVVADPSRTGLGKPGVNVIVQTRAAVIALVSCDAASLGRDARLLTEAGYTFEYATVIDMFPHTSHVEVVSRFVRNPESIVGSPESPATAVGSSDGAMAP